MVDKQTDEASGLPEDISAEDVMALAEAGDEMIRQSAKDLVDDAAEKILKKDMLPARALDLSPDTMEGMYSYAYSLYNRASYDEAMSAFQMLMMLDCREFKYFMGHAACVHMKGEYMEAIQQYFLAASLDVENPMPYYYAADCFDKVDNPTGAREALSYALDVAGDKPEHAVLVERCKLMSEGLREASEKEIAKYQAAGEAAEAKKAAKKEKKAARAQKRKKK